MNGETPQSLCDSSPINRGAERRDTRGKRQLSNGRPVSEMGMWSFFRHAPSPTGWVPSAFGNIFFVELRGHRPRSYTHEPTSKVRSHDAAHTIASLGYVLFFRHAPSPTGGFPPKKEVFRLSYQFFIREFCSTFGRRLGIANSPESTFAQCSPYYRVAHTFFETYGFAF